MGGSRPYPAVYQLVGNDFFEGAAAVFIVQQPPRAACLHPLSRKNGTLESTMAGDYNTGTSVSMTNDRNGRLHEEPARLARSGPDWPLIGLFKSSPGTPGIQDGQHEAHFPPTQTTVSLLPLVAAPATCSDSRSAGQNGPPMVTLSIRKSEICAIIR
jgi:hypothetical protein